ncbi:MAG: Gfo/Idh/MocA family oxidoreductase [Victivallales bacterium]|nr:Gfo/Idh/MocA family oxidoreductase [Eubacteriales bacterium]
MLRIGTVNIDTSHAPSFAEILLKGDRARYTAIYNDGFRTDKDVDAFMVKYGLETRYYDLAEMAKHIDVAFIQSCDWDRHIELSLPFVDAGIPVFIDKPLVGNIRDLETIEKWNAEGKIILGTSAMRYTYEHDDFFANAKTEDIISLTATVGVDEFNYAIHAVEEIMGFMDGISPVSTQFLGINTVGAEDDKIEVDSYRVLFENGVSAYYHICKKGWQPSTAIIMCKKTTYVYKIDSGKVYEAMLKRVCDYFEGNKSRLASVKSMCDSIRVMLAGRKSYQNGGRTENIYEITAKDGGFDGLVFYKGYKAQSGY